MQGIPLQELQENKYILPPLAFAVCLAALLKSILAPYRSDTYTNTRGMNLEQSKQAQYGN